MRRIVLLSLFALLVPHSPAQRGGGGAHSFGRGGFAFHRARSPFPSAYPYGYGYNYLPYDTVAPYAYSPQPIFLVPPPPPAIEPPPREVHPVVTDYKFPAASGSAEPQTFAIVLKDGSTLAATTIVSSADGLHFVDPDERHLRISMAAVDRAATLKLNRDRKLTLYLPAPQ